ncbi:DUF4255 domain-containing protein [Roseofilum casamattae]|uniref:DUF4255 domain-containing protein n=1 Tax=Roseofilum casamattae BLCC-M143 TaxID=3022442 RepID=A0ABT7BX48_9CYAN|nr:DUF4255 domain-containing protein [Roseofilum casamattae]MDJ1183765.1 DUF4255 domain-containing protein [Roseofilum casamattae BLCC-M143]
MANYLAIATATATLQRIIQQAVQADVDGSRVTTVRPDGAGGGIPETGVNLYLYHVKRNPALTNQDTPNFQRRGDMVKRRQAALDLFYVISCYGNDAELEPQRLLGSVARALEDQLEFTPSMIRETIDDPTFDYLEGSDLADQIDQIRAEFVSVSTDEMSKIWSVFFQTPHALSVVYKITVILVESDVPAQSSLPVRDRYMVGGPFPKQPVVSQVINTTGKFMPIVASSTLRIRGQFLSSDIVHVRINQVEVAPQQVSDNEIILPLRLIDNTYLRAGVQSLTVIHPQLPPESSANGRGRGRTETAASTTIPTQKVQSNIAPFVLRPSFLGYELVDIEGTEEDQLSGEIHVRTNVMVGAGQRVVLMLNKYTTEDPVAYLFNSRPIREATQNPEFPISNIPPGEYLIRVQVDGAESLLTVDSERTSPTYEQYIGPILTLE